MWLVPQLFVITQFVTASLYLTGSPFLLGEKKSALGTFFITGEKNIFIISLIQPSYKI